METLYDGDSDSVQYIQSRSRGSMYYQPRKIVGQQVASETDENTRKPDLKTRLILGDIVD